MIAQPKEIKNCFTACTQEIIEKGRCDCLNRILEKTLKQSLKTEEELTRNINSI
jgi:hypothetical protein